MKETWNVLDPDEYVKHNPFMGYTNMKIEKISPECSEISMKITHGVTNLMGMVHGGMLYALADVVTGLTARAVFVTVETEKKILSVLAAWWKMPAAGMGRSRRNMGGVCMQLKKFLMEEDGVGVIEVVLILVVLIGLVIVFKTQINKLLTAIFTEINKQAKEVY